QAPWLREDVGGETLREGLQQAIATSLEDPPRKRLDGYVVAGPLQRVGLCHLLGIRDQLEVDAEMATQRAFGGQVAVVTVAFQPAQNDPAGRLIRRFCSHVLTNTPLRVIILE